MSASFQYSKCHQDSEKKRSGIIPSTLSYHLEYRGSLADEIVRTIATRKKENERAFRLKEHHNINFNETTALVRAPGFYSLTRRELVIELHPKNINRGDGLHISQIWTS